MNPGNPLNSLNTPTAIAVGCGLVGCLTLTVGVMLRGADRQMPPVAVGVGSAALIVSGIFGVGAGVGATLQSRKTLAVRTVVIPQSQIAPDFSPPVRPQPEQEYMARITFVSPQTAISSPQAAIADTVLQPTQFTPQPESEPYPEYANTGYPEEVRPEEADEEQDENEADAWDTSVPPFPDMGSNYDYSAVRFRR